MNGSFFMDEYSYVDFFLIKCQITIWHPFYFNQHIFLNYSVANSRMRVQLNEIARKANGITSVVKYTEPRTKKKSNHNEYLSKAFYKRIINGFENSKLKI